LERAQTLIGRDKLTVFAVSFQEDPTAVAAIRKMASSWHVNMIDDNDGAIASRYAISTIPAIRRRLGCADDVLPGEGVPSDRA
jgi:hypothetical protein